MTDEEMAPEGGTASARIGQVGRLALVMSGVLGPIGFFSVSVVLPQIQAEFASQPNAALLTSLVGALVPLVFALSSPMMGRLIDRVGYRRVYLASLFTFAVAGGAVGLLHDLWAILALRVVLGVAVAGILNSGSAGVGSLPEAERPRLFGMLSLTGAIGGILLFPIAGFLAGFGWRATFAVHLAALLIVPLVLMLPRNTAVERPGAGSARAGLGVPLPLLLMAGFIGLAIFAGAMFSSFHLNDIGVVKPTLISIPLSMMSFVSLGTAGSYSLVVRRLGRNGTFAMAFMLLAAGLVLAGMSTSLEVFTVGLGLVGAGFGYAIPNLNAAAVAAAEGAPGRAVGMINAAMYGAQVLFPFIATPIRGIASNAAMFLGLGVIALCLSLGFSSRIRRSQVARPA